MNDRQTNLNTSLTHDMEEVSDASGRDERMISCRVVTEDLVTFERVSVTSCLTNGFQFVATERSRSVTLEDSLMDELMQDRRFCQWIVRGRPTKPHLACVRDWSNVTGHCSNYYIVQHPLPRDKLLREGSRHTQVCENIGNRIIRSFDNYCRWLIV